MTLPEIEEAIWKLLGTLDLRRTLRKAVQLGDLLNMALERKGMEEYLKWVVRFGLGRRSEQLHRQGANICADNPKYLDRFKTLNDLLTFFRRASHETHKAEEPTPEVDPQRQAWETPTSIFDSLLQVFHFTIDAAASKQNAKLPRYWTEEDDGLRQDWSRETVFCNPPFQDVGPWLEKARTAKTAVVFFLANALTTKAYHDNPPDYLLLPRGRIKYTLEGRSQKGATGANASFGSVILVYGRVTEGQERQVCKSWLAYRHVRKRPLHCS